jgi:hypothetical protein
MYIDCRILVALLVEFLIRIYLDQTVISLICSFISIRRVLKWTFDREVQQNKLT